MSFFYSLRANNIFIMQNGEISIMEALNQIQSWLNSKELDKAIQGCQEILAIEPDNRRALALLKQAKEAQHEKNILENLSMENLSVEEDKKDKADNKNINDAKKEDCHFYTPPRPNKRKLFLAMLIPAIIVVVLGGLIINSINNIKRNKILTNQKTEETDTTSEKPDTTYLKENDQRVSDLIEMSDVIENYFQENGKYPDLNEVEDLLKEKLGRVPKDPRQGDKDASGDPYGYMYALYYSKKTKKDAYILSALFQDSKGEAHAWAQGASTKNYTDFREIDAPYVIWIGN